MLHRKALRTGSHAAIIIIGGEKMSLIAKKQALVFREENTKAGSLQIRGLLKSMDGTEKYLNETAAKIVELYFFQKLPLKEVVEILSSQYYAPRNVIEESVRDFISTLTREINFEAHTLTRKQTSPPSTPLEWYLSAPIDIFLELTYKCNLRCKHCYASAGIPSKNELSTGEIRSLLREAAEMGVIRVALGGGEPLLREDFIDIVRYAAGLGLWVEFSTNGYFLTEDVVKKLTSLGIFWVQISLESSDKRVNDYIRSSGAFDAAVKAIRLAKEKGLFVTVRTTLNKVNASMLGEMLSFLQELNVDAWFIAQLIPSGRALHYKNWLLTNDEYVEAVNRVKSKARGKPKIIGGGENTSRLGGKASSSKVLCPAAFSILSVTPTGNVKPCPYFPDNFSAGNIRETSLREIWHKSMLFRKIRGLYRRDLMEPCRSCPLQCNGGCRAAAAAVYGRLEAPDPLCPRTGWVRGAKHRG